MDAALRLENLSVGYGKKALIQDITLAVKPGEILTLIGPNGAGKSTILKSLTRQLSTISGNVCYVSKDAKDVSDEELARLLSMVMTEHIRPELMTCREVVETGRYPYTGRLGILREEDHKQVELSMKLVHADEVSEKEFMKCSDGQKQRVMLARALCQNTQILILDEPTSYLDMRFRLEILHSIRKMARERKLAVVMSLHELDLAAMISDMIACVDGEKIARLGTGEEIFRGTIIQKLYGVACENFDPLLHTMYLPKISKKPEAFVIGGGGSGITTYYRLQREEIAFAAGILFENEAEYNVARALSAEVVSAKAFYPIEQKQLDRAKELIQECEYCICTLQELGVFNKPCQELIDFALQEGKLQWQK